MVKREQIRAFVEVVFTALLFGTQTILNSGIFISVMIAPLLPYLLYLPNYLKMNPYVIFDEIKITFFYNSFFVGQIVTYVGLGVFLVAGSQWFLNRHKKVGLFKTGLYSKVRHPQFTGIITTTLGLTLIVLIMGNLEFTRPFAGSHLNVATAVGLWFLQVLGYIAIARYEDWRLSKKFGDEYKEYRSRVPFLFPAKSPKRIPETLFTILIVIAICCVLLLLPYDFIRVYSHKYIPQIFPF